LEFRKFDIEGPLEVLPRKIRDERGYFAETLRLNLLRQHVGQINFVQDNQSLSVKAGTIRGIHFQSPPAAQGKLVRCVSGKLLDVAVDLRSGSPTFGRWISVVLSPEAINRLWVPIGFGHGFCSLEPNSIIAYQCTDYYSADHDCGVAWDDPDIGIEWPEIADAGTLSPKDKQQPRLSELPPLFAMGDHR
jgi:dTDP-4-dehydrorhamnose 3,5-epimerase